MSRRPHLIAGGLTVLLGLVWNLTATYHTVRLVWFSGNPAWLAVPTADGSRVGPVRPNGPADGRLIRGDEIVAVDGRGVDRTFEARGHFAFEPPRPYDLLIRRDGRLVRLQLETIPFGLSYASVMTLGFLSVQWIFWAVGAGVFLMRPHDALPGLLSRVLLLFALGLNLQVPVEKLAPPDIALAALAQLLASLFWPSFLHLFLVFPEPSPLLRRFPGLVRWIYVVGSAFTLSLLGVLALGIEGMDVVAEFFSRPSPLSRLLGALVVAVMEEARRIWREKNLAGLDQIEKPVEKIKRLLVNTRDHYLKDSESLPGGCIFVTFSVELDDQLPELAREVKKGFDSLKSMISQLLEQGKDSGELREETDSKAVTELVFAGILGATIIYGMDKFPTELDQTINALLDYLNHLGPP